MVPVRRSLPILGGAPFESAFRQAEAALGEGRGDLEVGARTVKGPVWSSGSISA